MSLDEPQSPSATVMPAASMVMSGLNDVTEAEAVALRCDDPNFSLGWEAALYHSLCAKFNQGHVSLISQMRGYGYCRRAAARQGGTSPAASGRLEVQTRTDAEPGPQEASGAVWGDRLDTQPAPKEMSVCLSPCGTQTAFGIRSTTALGFSFLLMDRKMRPQKKKKPFSLQEESKK